MEQETQTRKEWFVSEFEGFEKSLNGGKHVPFHGVRREAFERLLELGFPTSKQEEWKYTSVSPLARTSFHLPTGEESKLPSKSEVESFCAQGSDAPCFVFVNGSFVESLSSLGELPYGVFACPLRELLQAKETDGYKRDDLLSHLGLYAPYGDQAFVALNTAFLNDGLFLKIKRRAVVDEPLQLLFLTTAGQDKIVTNPRVMIIAEEQSQASIIETYAGLGESTYFTSAVTEIAVSREATVDHYKVQQEGSKAYHVSTIQSMQERDSRLSLHSFSLGGLMVRNEVRPTLAGEGCETILNGLSVLCENQHVDNHTVIDHCKPHCESNELYKGIYADSSHGVFSGTIIVQPHAQKTNAIQSNQSLLLSETACVDSRPQLKIWADDVKCTHGATVGQLDEDALYYLQTRGIGRDQAQEMLMQAFAGDIVEQVKIELLRKYLKGLLEQRLWSLRPAHQ